MEHWVYHDGGRAAAGFKGDTGDCVVRSIAIATGQPYRQVYEAVFAANRRFAEGRSRAALQARKNPSPREGAFREVYDPYIKSLGFEWVPTMFIGHGCKVHLRADELPTGTLIARVSRHLVAVIDGVIYDTSDCSREGTRCVYGYYRMVEGGAL